MKRTLLLAPAALFLVLLSEASADYIVIKIDATRNYLKDRSGGNRPGSQMPGFQGGGMMGMMGGGGMMGRGMMGGGMMGGGMMGGGMMGGGMMGRGMMGGGMGGMGRGMMGGGMSGGGMMPGGAGYMGSRPGGGMAPGGGGGYMGGRGGMPPGAGFPGSPGGGPGTPPGGANKTGVPGAHPGEAAANEYQPHWLYAYIELRGKPRPQFQRKGRENVLTHIEFDHAWGHTCRIPVDLVRLPYNSDDTSVDANVIVSKNIDQLFDEGLRIAKKSKDPVALLRHAEWSLEHGLLDKFHMLMKDLRKAPGAPEVVKSALAAYTSTRSAMRKAPERDDPAHATLIEELTRSGYRSLTSKEGHYTLLTNLPEKRHEEVARRLALIEETYEKFFYWSALHGNELVKQVPARRLLAVLVASGQEFYEKHMAWGAVPVVGDGFLPRRDNVMILSAEHLDDAFALLKMSNDANLQNPGRHELLTGSFWKTLNPNRRVTTQQMLEDYSYMQALVLAEAAIEAEAERATISHEATRQLLFATGLLPHNVDVPEWIQYGLSSFFETPPASFYPGVGLPSWTNLLQFKAYRGTNTLRSGGDVLLRVGTDKYFQRAKDSVTRFADASDSAALAQRAHTDRSLAQSTAWALVYYLTKQNKLNLLLRYSAELDRLPRDLQLSERVLRGCFARAFKLKTPADMQRFGDEWFTFISQNELELQQYGRDYLQYLVGQQASRRPRARP